ncbi:hypothetical protein BD410DRAFT_641092 [Rickenella mellea]|uniref:Uncharacterized protein n=1 Tax=Rickenella mellea TaxID=50990 RepID=A0A4Y7PP64_9AGAM|nr:hypothetical protein BD410DRAFT_641092 [Rickenella mellea]
MNSFIHFMLTLAWWGRNGDAYQWVDVVSDVTLSLRVMADLPSKRTNKRGRSTSNTAPKIANKRAKKK